MPGPVEIRVPAELRQLAVVRAVASTLAERHNLDLDAISDLTMAADEVCAELVERAQRGTTVACRFDVNNAVFRIHGSVRPQSRGAQSTTSFGWRVLTTLMDGADSWQEGKNLHISAVRTC
ncbi:ATP-binding protein [Fodinicola acaciae]|uniref:ATP-binding protein n=1 Tax=Fodinicola acaciae TaxID=2681555 RepID=UPI0013D31DAA|nr:ATP-binding protein [Fodinicola acaciae]